MTPLLITPEDAARLRSLAQAWEGTPWVAEGCIRGTGASCTGLPYGILAEFGHVAPALPTRIGLPKSEILPTCLAWLNSHPELYQPVAETAVIRAGDVLIFDLGIGHAALATGGTEMFHSWQSMGAHFGNFSDVKLAKRLRGAWRPITL